MIINNITDNMNEINNIIKVLFIVTISWVLNERRLITNR